jgi:hypothetical protein
MATSLRHGDSRKAANRLSLAYQPFLDFRYPLLDFLWRSQGYINNATRTPPVCQYEWDPF